MLRQRGASWVVVFDEDFGLPADREPRLKAQGCTTNLARCFFGRQGYVIWDGYWNEPAEPFVYSAHGESLQIKAGPVAATTALGRCSCTDQALAGGKSLAPGLCNK